jgi:hypothetical protein
VPADAQRYGYLLACADRRWTPASCFSRRLPAPIIVMGLRVERRTSATKLCDADRCRRCERDATTINAAPTDSATRTEQAGPVANRCRTSTWGKASRHASRASRIEVSSRVEPRSHTCSVVRPTPRRWAARKAYPSATAGTLVRSKATTTLPAEFPRIDPLDSSTTATGRLARRATSLSTDVDNERLRPDL